jgi:Zn finger protein HypA/HybF involved in hydrogenase expression
LPASRVARATARRRTRVPAAGPASAKDEPDNAEATVNGRRWLGASLLTMATGLVLSAGIAINRAQEPQQYGDDAAGAPQAKVVNPHGPLTIPCQNCHTYTSWKPIRSMPEFNHDNTRYPLRGMHKDVPCAGCHTSLVFKNVSLRCADCHADLHRRQFGANCENCHSVKGWKVSVREIQDHRNRFPLVGAHAMLDCEACHKGAATGQFAGLSTACYTCHQQEFKTSNFDHVSAGFPTTCENCHTVDTWFGAKFDHLKYTGYALTGMHATLECTACHINGKYKGTPAACFACHQPDYKRTVDPSHVQAALPHDCGICHSTANWLNAKFDHLAYTGYALTGKHATLQCKQCHASGYAGTPSACASCHQKDYNGTTNPNHKAAGFPTDCSICHTTAGWIPSSFDHSKSGFPLTGAHKTTPCVQCHVNNNYTTIPKDCYSCHQAQYKATTDPNHVAAGFPTTCETCHTTVSWAGASFDHSKTGFPLTGAHVHTPCMKCHINNVFAGTPKDCYSCHRADYNGTTDPNHVAAGFPTTCQTCHNTTSWAGATFDHTWFPIRHGGANGVCKTCHTNSSNYSVFTCTNCHSKSKTDGQHSGVSGYVYNSVNCYACHRNPGGGN